MTSKPITLYRPEVNVLGIDLGTTNIACAIHKAGDTKSEVVIFDNGQKIMPSFVELSEQGTLQSCGIHAVDKWETNARHILYGINSL